MFSHFVQFVGGFLYSIFHGFRKDDALLPKNFENMFWGIGMIAIIVVIGLLSMCSPK